MVHFRAMETLKSKPIWLLWKLEMRDDRPTKVPYKNAREYASSTDASTWASYNDLHKKYFSSNPPTEKKGLGIVFEDNQNVIGVDFDHCVTDGKTHPEVLDFLEAANTYVEYSPSGTGLHLLFQKTEKVELAANKHHFDSYSIEVYTQGRYFTFTGNEHDESQSIRSISAEDLYSLLATLGYPWKKEKPIVTPNEPTPHTLDDDEVLRKMFASKNGSKIKSTWEGSIEQHNNDCSSADHSLCMHLAFWTGKNYQQIERLWLQSPLGQRKKTQDREDYRTRTINSAIHSTTDVYAPSAVPKSVADGIDYEFIMKPAGKNKDPEPKMIFPNINRVLRKNPHFAGKLRRNDFSQMVEVKERNNEWVSLNDNFISETREFIAENFPAFVGVGKEMVTDAIIRVAGDTRVNPPRDYITSIEWDNKPRINSWLHHTYGTPDDDVHQAIGANWLKGLVKRIMQPGCQFDEVLALESGQGYRKSTSLRVLAQPWHVETTHSLDSKDFYLLLAQNVVVEFSEGEIMDRASVNKLKAEITKTEDQLRPPYERGMVRFPRSCVFAVTTNRLELKDETGNRRWLPVKLTKVADIDWLEENRDQLFAEAYHRAIVLGETTYEYPEELKDLQESRQEYDERQEVLIETLAKYKPNELEEEGLMLKTACNIVYGSDHQANKLDEIRVSAMLQRMHMVNDRKYVGGKRVRRWFPSEKTVTLLEEVITNDNDF